MNKNWLVLVGIVIVFYLCCVALCNLEHNRALGKTNGWDPCASCWALRVGD